ncbi:MAG: PP2C family protein-serine/threonine phosphatase [Thermodesulfovibrionales bacterium]
MLTDVIIADTSMNEYACIDSVEEKLLYIVADGMGGHARGDVASKAVLDEFMEHREEMSSTEDIVNALKAAKRRLNEIARAEGNAIGLGAAVAGIMLNGKKAAVFNCGDCRVYRLNGHYFERISKDHSLVQGLVDNGIITDDDMRTHPQRNIITAAIMGDLKDDDPEVFVKEMEIKGTQIFLLCTDGLWECVDTKDMEACFSSGILESSVNCLISKAMDSLLGDNVSLIALEVTVD